MKHEFYEKLYGRTPLPEHANKYGVPHLELCTLNDLKVFAQVGKDMGLDIKVLAMAGQKYTVNTSEYYESPDGVPTGESFNSSTRIVPKGKVYIEITNEMRKMGEFYKKVDTLSEKARNPQRIAAK